MESVIFQKSLSILMALTSQDLGVRYSHYCGSVAASMLYQQTELFMHTQIFTSVFIPAYLYIFLKPQVYTYTSITVQ